MSGTAGPADQNRNPRSARTQAAAPALRDRPPLAIRKQFSFDDPDRPPLAIRKQFSFDDPDRPPLAIRKQFSFDDLDDAYVSREEEEGNRRYIYRSDERYNNPSRANDGVPRQSRDPRATTELPAQQNPSYNVATAVQTASPQEVWAQLAQVLPAEALMQHRNYIASLPDVGARVAYLRGLASHLGMGPVGQPQPRQVEQPQRQGGQPSSPQRGSNEAREDFSEYDVDVLDDEGKRFPARAKCDTGSDDNFVSRDLIDRMELSDELQELDEWKVFYSINNVKVKTQYVIRLRWWDKVRHKHFSETFLVIDDSRYDLILGMAYIIMERIFVRPETKKSALVLRRPKRTKKEEDEEASRRGAQAQSGAEQQSAQVEAWLNQVEGHYQAVFAGRPGGSAQRSSITSYNAYDATVQRMLREGMTLRQAFDKIVGELMIRRGASREEVEREVSTNLASYLRAQRSSA